MMSQTSCPKCLTVIADGAAECPACGATEETLRAEAALAREHQLPAAKPSIFRWKRESVQLLIMLLGGLAIVMLFRWLLWTALGGSWDSGWTLPI